MIPTDMLRAMRCGSTIKELARWFELNHHFQTSGLRRVANNGKKATRRYEPRGGFLCLFRQGTYQWIYAPKSLAMNSYLSPPLEKQKVEERVIIMFCFSFQTYVQQKAVPRVLSTAGCVKCAQDRRAMPTDLEAKLRRAHESAILYAQRILLVHAAFGLHGEKHRARRQGLAEGGGWWMLYAERLAIGAGSRSWTIPIPWSPRCPGPLRMSRCRIWPTSRGGSCCSATLSPGREQLESSFPSSRCSFGKIQTQLRKLGKIVSESGNVPVVPYSPNKLVVAVRCQSPFVMVMLETAWLSEGVALFFGPLILSVRLTYLA